MRRWKTSREFTCPASVPSSAVRVARSVRADFTGENGRYSPRPTMMAASVTNTRTCTYQGISRNEIAIVLSHPLRRGSRSRCWRRRRSGRLIRGRRSKVRGHGKLKKLHVGIIVLVRFFNFHGLEISGTAKLRNIFRYGVDRAGGAGERQLIPFTR